MEWPSHHSFLPICLQPWLLFSIEWSNWCQKCDRGEKFMMGISTTGCFYDFVKEKDDIHFQFWKIIITVSTEFFSWFWPKCIVIRKDLKDSDAETHPARSPNTQLGKQWVLFLKKEEMLGGSQRFSNCACTPILPAMIFFFALAPWRCANHQSQCSFHDSLPHTFGCTWFIES